jgi:hypothetical protein
MDLHTFQLSPVLRLKTLKSDIAITVKFFSVERLLAMVCASLSAGSIRRIDRVFDLNAGLPLHHQVRSF